MEGAGVTPLFVGITGGSGCGKTTFAEKLRRRLPVDSTVLITQDSYYLDLRHLPVKKRNKVNFDRPEALENSLLAGHLRSLRLNRSVDIPVYDFRTQTRTGTRKLEPGRIVIVEGILLFWDAELRSRFDFKIFIDTDPDIRLIRRLRRDLRRRGRNVDSVLDQWETSVRPAYLRYVDLMKRYADLSVSGNGSFDEAVESAVRKIEARIA